MNATIATAGLEILLAAAAPRWIAARFHAHDGRAVEVGARPPATATWERHDCEPHGHLELCTGADATARPTTTGGGPQAPEPPPDLLTGILAAFASLLEGAAAERATRDHRVRTLLTVAGGLLDVSRDPRLAAGRADDLQDRSRAAISACEALVTADDRLPPLLRSRAAAPSLVDEVARAVDDVRWASPAHRIEGPTITGATTARYPPRAARDVVLQLLDNAVAHTPAGTHVLVQVDLRPDVVLLIVDDDGPGATDVRYGTGLRTVLELLQEADGDLSLRTSSRGGLRARARWRVEGGPVTGGRDRPGGRTEGSGR